MNLKDFLAAREKPPELYWSLVIEPGWVQAGIWFIGGTAAEVVNVSPGAAWETEEELVGACDAALSSSVQKLPEETPEPNKTVFGVPSNWVKGGEIQEEYLTKIKNICTDLSLTPVGFVVLPEAIAHLYKSTEGVPLSALIIGLGKEFLEITVFKLGNLVGTTSVSRSVSLIEDVTEGLARFEGATPLPSRIIVFDGKEGELEEAKETLMQASWESEKVKFLHTPKVEILTSDKKVIATSLAGAAEIGHVTMVSAKEEEPEAPPEDVQNISVPTESVSPQEMGFAIGEDISARQVKEPEHVPVRQSRNFQAAKSAGLLFTRVKNFFSGISGRFFAKPVVSPARVGRRPLIIGSVALILFLVLGMLYWWFYPKATVTVFVSPKNFSEDVNLSFSTDGKSDMSAGIIPAAALTSKMSGDKTKATTGTKLIGDKAKGTVNILNFTSNIVNLSAGTILNSSANLRFVTNNEASISAVIASGSQNVAGSALVDVTASDIGSQYNLAKDEIFTVGNFSKVNLRAQSTANFSGGSSQEISAVSKVDQTSLEADLKSELLGQAAGDLAGKVGKNQIFVTDLAGSDIVSENFDHKIGDEADNLKLSLALDVTGIAAEEDKMLEYARALLKDKIPSGFILRDAQINFKFTFIDRKDGLYNYKATVSANFLPEVNPDAIINRISGKTPKVAESYLNSIPGFVHAEVKVKPNLPGFLGTLPHVHKNITIDVVAEQ